VARPSGVVVLDGELYVSDGGNHRILRWQQVPAESAQPADSVHGQPDFTSGGANQGGLTGASLSRPAGLFALPDRLAIADGGNNRVVLLPTAGW